MRRELGVNTVLSSYRCMRNPRGEAGYCNQTSLDQGSELEDNEQKRPKKEKRPTKRIKEDYNITMALH